MKMWAKIRKPSTKKKRVPPSVFSLPREVHILPNRPKSKKKPSFRPSPTTTSAMDASSKDHPEIVVPAFSFSNGRPISDENLFPNHPTWESIESTGKRPMEYEEQLSVLTNKNYGVPESRQDSFSVSRPSTVSRKVSFLEEIHQQQQREAPPEAARSKILAQNRSFRRKQVRNNPRKFALRPKSIVRKWNRYADMEEKGLSASPRHRTKLAKTLHLELATASLDSNEDVAQVDYSMMPVVEEEEEDNLANIQESCSYRDLQGCKGENENDASTTADLMPVDDGSLTFSQESCANRCVQVDSVELKLEDNTISSNKEHSDEPASMICKDSIRRITESGFPASVLEDNEPIQDLSEDEPTSVSKVTICTTNESESTSVSSISDNETDLSNQKMQTDTPNDCSRQEEIVTLSLAQILVQSYQPDPDNPGYWKKKQLDVETKTNPPAAKSYLRKDFPLPTLNTFLAEVKARRNEIMTKSNEPKVQEGENVDWYGVKRDDKQASRANHRACQTVQRTNTSPKDLFAELKAKQRDIIGGRPKSSKPNQKRVVVCKASSGSANDLLSELKAKQRELKQRRAIPPTKEASVDEKGTGFLPDLMTELKAKQRKIKSRPPGPAKRVVRDPITAKRSTSSNSGVMSELKAKQRAIEDRFYARLANLQSSLRGNEVVVIPNKS